jgi:hypothetical protein
VWEHSGKLSHLGKEGKDKPSIMLLTCGNNRERERERERDRERELKHTHTHTGRAGGGVGAVGQRIQNSDTQNEQV